MIHRDDLALTGRGVDERASSPSALCAAKCSRSGKRARSRGAHAARSRRRKPRTRRCAPPRPRFARTRAKFSPPMRRTWRRQSRQPVGRAARPSDARRQAHRSDGEGCRRCRRACPIRSAANWRAGRVPNGLDIARVATPIGVIGMIYESRPNVTADAGALALKSGNVAILRGGSESARSSARDPCRDGRRLARGRTCRTLRSALCRRPIAPRSA